MAHLREAACLPQPVRLARIPAQRRETLRVRDAATPLPQNAMCPPDDLLEDVLVQRHALRGTESR
ncbi:hypothetical protein [Streptomyces blattellae]|uniref:hypothetical protein n=1 Tax=Streptomyces blattellae TaxID=2569855 RepID=UPI0012B8D2D5|nr:hypothetical protein [Streptomyces blattellae]